MNVLLVTTLSISLIESYIVLLPAASTLKYQFPVSPTVVSNCNGCPGSPGSLSETLLTTLSFPPIVFTFSTGLTFPDSDSLRVFAILI